MHLYQLHDRIAVRDGGHGWAPHGAKRLTASEVLSPGGLGDALLRVKQEGKISALGLTTFGGDPAAVREVIDSGLFDALNCSIHMLNPTAVHPPAGHWSGLNYAGIAEHAHRLGMAVLGIRGLGGGALARMAGVETPTSQWADRDHPDLVGNDEVRELLRAELNRADGSPAVAAMAWVLRWPQISTLIGGFTLAPQVDDAVAAEEQSASWSPESAVAWCERLYAAGERRSGADLTGGQ